MQLKQSLYLTHRAYIEGKNEHTHTHTHTCARTHAHAHTQTQSCTQTQIQVHYTTVKQKLKREKSGWQAFSDSLLKQDSAKTCKKKTKSVFLFFQYILPPRSVSLQMYDAVLRKSISVLDAH